ncbi:MAG: hybrid sensor histidine kinase/response regulator [Fibrobacteres bacterium]|nr:hybrid sensor histidine kinase/response regulator [Fibrobacterota bacterium]
MIELRENESEGTDRNPAGLCDNPADCVWRLETLGKVTEGVVHDFNNILATISGFAELILTTDDRPGANRKSVTDFARHILQAAATGQSTVRELRVFTRQPGSEKEILDLHDVLMQSMGMARGAMGGRISISSDFLPGSASVEGCRGLLHNIFINLFFNARDAMPRGGDITVKTSLLRGILPGLQGVPDVLVVSVKDTGAGMTDEVRARLFEPFFTTKGRLGSGLGLANVAATVKAHGGWITVESALERGTEFRIHFPLCDPRA